MYDFNTSAPSTRFSNSRRTSTSSRPRTIPIWIFLCNAETRHECLERNLFGTQAKSWFRQFGSVEKGDYAMLFDYDCERCQLIGMFEIEDHANGRSIESRAWKGQFPSQVRVRVLGERQSRSPNELEMGLARRVFPGGSKSYPVACVEGADAVRLAALFGVQAETRSGEPTRRSSVRVIPKPLDSVPDDAAISCEEQIPAVQPEMPAEVLLQSTDVKSNVVRQSTLPGRFWTFWLWVFGLSRH